MISRETLHLHLSDFHKNRAEVEKALDQNTRALEQIRGAVWYIENVLLKTLDDNQSDGGDPTSPPRSEPTE